MYPLSRRAIAEFIGTLALIFIGAGSIVADRLSGGGDPQRVARAYCSGTGNELRRWPRPRAGVCSGREREGRSDRGS